LPNGNLDDEYPVRAFEEWVDHVGRSQGQSVGQSASRPFFAVLKFEASHFPYQQGFHVPVRFSPADLSPAELRSLSFLSYPRELAARLQRRYWNSLSYEDGLIHRVLEHLRSRKALDNTVVIVFGDHGELFYENGAVTHADRLWEQTLHAAFVVWGAKNWVASEYAEPVSLLDIAPMVLDLAGVAPYRGFQGRVPAGLEPGGATVEAEPRPIFSVAQSTRFEESVLVGPWRYVLQSDGLYESLHDVLRDPFETHDEMQPHPEVAECLYATLAEFRRNQLGYYNRPDLVQSFFPPRHRLADVPACAGLREGSR
jgi:arylsulfatase A-like enzyme